MIANKLEMPQGHWKDVQEIMRNPDFQHDVLVARRDLVAASVEAIKRNLMSYVLEADKLARNSSDARTKHSALKDLMDRGGIGATQKIALNSPAAYRDSVKDLVEDDPKIGGTDPD